MPNGDVAYSNEISGRSITHIENLMALSESCGHFTIETCVNLPDFLILKFDLFGFFDLTMNLISYFFC